MKDNISTIGSTTTCASGSLKDYKSPYDATIVEWLGEREPDRWLKTNMDEFGMGSHSQFSHFGPVKSGSVKQAFRSPGGSSGGTAVLVANHTAGVGIGTDTGGSVRLPASYCAIVGFKPSYGAIPRYGVVPYANSLDTVGLMTKTITKMRRIYEKPSMMYDDSRDPTSPTLSSRQRYAKNVNRASSYMPKDQRLGKLKIGVPAEYHVKELSEYVRLAWIGVLKKLQSAGHTIVPISIPSTKYALSAYYVLAAAEAASNLAKYDGVRYGSRGPDNDADNGVLYAATRGEGFGEEVKRRILLGNYTLSSEAIDNHFIQAQKVRRLVQRDFDRVFATDNPLHDRKQFDMSEMDESIDLESKLGPAQVDVIVCPTSSSLAPKVDDLKRLRPLEAYTTDVLTVPASLAGLPALSVPVKIPFVTKESGIRAGMQIIGQYWDDQLVLKVGELVSEEVPPKSSKFGSGSRSVQMSTESSAP